MSRISSLLVESFHFSSLSSEGWLSSNSITLCLTSHNVLYALLSYVVSHGIFKTVDHASNCLNHERRWWHQYWFNTSLKHRCWSFLKNSSQSQDFSAAYAHKTYWDYPCIFIKAFQKNQCKMELKYVYFAAESFRNLCIDISIMHIFPWKFWRPLIYTDMKYLNQGLAQWSSGSSCHLWWWHPYDCWFESWMLHFWSRFG